MEIPAARISPFAFSDSRAPIKSCADSPKRVSWAMQQQSLKVIYPQATQRAVRLLFGPFRCICHTRRQRGELGNHTPLRYAHLSQASLAISVGDRRVERIDVRGTSPCQNLGGGGCTHLTRNIGDAILPSKLHGPKREPHHCEELRFRRHARLTHSSVSSVHCSV